MSVVICENDKYIMEFFGVSDRGQKKYICKKCHRQVNVNQEDLDNNEFVEA